MRKGGGAKQFRGGCEKKFSRASRAVKFRTPLFKFLNTPLQSKESGVDISYREYAASQGYAHNNIYQVRDVPK